MSRLLASRPIVLVALVTLAAVAVLALAGAHWAAILVVSPLAGCGVVGARVVVQEARFAE